MIRDEALFLHLRGEAARIADGGTRQLYLNALVEIIGRAAAGMRPPTPQFAAARTPRRPVWDDDPDCTYEIDLVGRPNPE